MKNREVITAINNIINFQTKQQEKGTLLDVKGQYMLKKNKDELLKAYKPYEETKKEIDEKDVSEEEKTKEIQELLEIETEVAIQKIGLPNLKDGIVVEEIDMLDFMLD